MHPLSRETEYEIESSAKSSPPQAELPPSETHVEFDVPGDPRPESTRWESEERQTNRFKKLKRWWDSNSLFSPRTKNLMVAGWLVLSLTTLVGLPSLLSSKESAHSNWQHLLDVQKHNEERTAVGKPSELRRIQHNESSWVAGLELARGDIDATTTLGIRRALMENDVDAAERMLADAQQVDALSESERDEYVAPKLTPGMTQAIASQVSDLYHLYLFDCCAEDGDIVTLHLNGEPFATVPLTHSGVTLSVPIGAATSIGLSGTRDGGGGITVTFRTSRGDFFSNAIQPGEMHHVAVVH